MYPEVKLACEDKRGKIFNVSYKGVRFNVLFTKKGFARSGDFHNNKQFDLVLSGEWEITLKEGNQDNKMIKRENDFFCIPANVPHLFLCREDSVMIEWWDSEFEANYFKPYRDIVERLFEQENEDAKR